MVVALEVDTKISELGFSVWRKRGQVPLSLLIFTEKTLKILLEIKASLRPFGNFRVEEAFLNISLQLFLPESLGLPRFLNYKSAVVFGLNKHENQVENWYLQTSFFGFFRFVKMHFLVYIPERVFFFPICKCTVHLFVSQILWRYCTSLSTLLI